MLRRCLLLVVAVTMGSSALQDPLVVNTHKGKVKGKTVKTPLGGEVDAWYSIPFAQPPVGDLRFRHPRPIDRWHDVKDTTQLPNACWQTVDNFFGNFEGSTMWNANTPMSEDCLYLSIVVPKPRPTNVPVVVWVYGGGFYSGTSTLEVYDYRTFADHQNVIVVSPHYRVANLGFLYMGTPDTPGNTGLFDQRLALQWIHDNIEFFGGNPNNITLMGESAGAVSISMHLMSPLSRNYFSQAIMESGSATVPWGIISKRENMLRGQRLAESVGCPTNLKSPNIIIECLRSKNASVLVNNEVSNGVTDFPFVPIIDGAFFDEYPIDSLRKGNFKKTNIMMGSNTEEGYWFIMYFLPNLFRREENVTITRKQFEVAVRQLFPYFNELILQAIMFQYTDWLNPEDGAKNRNALDKMVGDYHFTCNVNEFSEYYAKGGNNVYMYYFKHRSSGNKWPKWMGTLHGDEISFLFGQPLNPKYREFTKAEQDLSRQMMTYWGNFIRTGNPNEGDHRSYAKTKWPLYTPETKEYLILDVNKPGIGRGPRAQQCSFWKKFLPQLVKHSDPDYFAAVIVEPNSCHLTGKIDVAKCNQPCRGDKPPVTAIVMKASPTNIDIGPPFLSLCGRNVSIPLVAGGNKIVHLFPHVGYGCYPYPEAKSVEDKECLVVFQKVAGARSIHVKIDFVDLNGEDVCHDFISVHEGKIPDEAKNEKRYCNGSISMSFNDVLAVNFHRMQNNKGVRLYMGFKLEFQLLMY